MLMNLLGMKQELGEQEKCHIFVNNCLIFISLHLLISRESENIFSSSRIINLLVFS